MWLCAALCPYSFPASMLPFAPLPCLRSFNVCISVCAHVCFTIATRQSQIEALRAQEAQAALDYAHRGDLSRVVRSSVHFLFVVFYRFLFAIDQRLYKRVPDIEGLLGIQRYLSAVIRRQRVRLFGMPS